MALRLALFDIDGTLIRTGGAGIGAFARVLASQFGVPNGCERVRFGGRTDPSLVRELFLQHGITPSEENVQRFFDGYVFYLDHLLPQMPGNVLPGVREWLHRWRGWPGSPRLGLLTGNQVAPLWTVG
ncbi:MAG: hypothetical protein NTW03_06450 [Verrucomicrobia bacterium]|nr:hypothetical protein [Verrucomicrobiota bacterium]